MPAIDKKHYLPSLDGLRALSIFMVIYSHLSVTHVLPHVLRASTLGSAAVILFFVLSGFLITSQLQIELKQMGAIRLGTFWIRRLFRLLPALVVMILVCLGLASRGLVPVSTRDIVHGLTYTADYYHPQYWTLAHLWSLSVEEQFYLIWPVLLTLAGLSRSKRVAVTVILIDPVFRLLAWSVGTDEALVFRRFELVADSLAFGCLLAMEHERIRESRIWKWISPSKMVLFSGILVLVCCLAHRIWPVSEVIGRSVISVCGFFMVAALAFYPRSRASRLLSFKLLAWMGRLSYSAYLWQQMFLVPTPGVSVTPLPLPYNLIAVFLASVTSYYLIETPMRRLGRKLTQTFPKPPVGPNASFSPLEPERIEA